MPNVWRFPVAFYDYREVPGGARCQYAVDVLHVKRDISVKVYQVNYSYSFRFRKAAWIGTTTPRWARTIENKFPPATGGNLFSIIRTHLIVDTSPLATHWTSTRSSSVVAADVALIVVIVTSWFFGLLCRCPCGLLEVPLAG